MKKRLACLTLALIMSASQVVSVSASREEELRQEQAWTSQQLNATYARINELWSQKQQLESEIAVLDENLVNVMVSIETMENDISNKEVEIIKTKQELSKAVRARDKQYEAMKLRIQYMYENGNGQFIETLLESQSIAEFLSNAEYISQISEYDRNMLVEFQNIVAQVEDQQEELEAENAELEKLQTDLQDQQAELEGLISSKSEEIAGLESELSATNAKIAELKAAAEEQARLQREAAALQNNPGIGVQPGDDVTPHTPGPSYTAPSGGGVLQNPCPSAYISSEFGGRQSPGGIGSTNHKGRDYAAASGTPIYAAASGTVTTVAYNSARGNYVIINHGDGLSTLYQHCSAIYVSAGQSVSAGKNIAAVGSTGISTGAHLHFEVHVNGTPVDPRLYL